MSKVAVVTGSTKGLGRGLATELLARGHRVAIVSPNGEDSASAARELGEGAAGFGCDVTDLAQVQARSEERRVGQEGVSTCRSRGSPCTSQKKTNIHDAVCTETILEKEYTESE